MCSSCCAIFSPWFDVLYMLYTFAFYFFSCYLFHFFCFFSFSSVSSRSFIYVQGRTYIVMYISFQTNEDCVSRRTGALPFCLYLFPPLQLHALVLYIFCYARHISSNVDIMLFLLHFCWKISTDPGGNGLFICCCRLFWRRAPSLTHACHLQWSLLHFCCSVPVILMLTFTQRTSWLIFWWYLFLFTALLLSIFNLFLANGVYALHRFAGGAGWLARRAPGDVGSFGYRWLALVFSLLYMVKEGGGLGRPLLPAWLFLNNFW